MLPRLRFALLMPVAMLLGCGGSSTNNITVPATVSTGDYIINVAPGSAQASTFTGAMTVSGSSVSGVFRYSNPGTNCVPPGQDIAFTGTISNGVLKLTSAAFSSSVATLSLTLPFGANTSNQQVSNGTAVITGGTCALASTTAKAQYIPSLAGTFSGTLNGPVSGTATAVITESAANSDGQFPATIALSFSSTANSTCSFSIPISSAVSTIISGATLQASSSTPNVTIQVNAGTLPAAYSVTYDPSGTGSTGCIGTYTGTLN